MNNKLFKSDFDYEEDEYDILSRIRQKGKDRCFTNKSKMEKPEFDYEEDPYEPEKA